MEPTIYVEKFDPETGAVIDDRGLDSRQHRPEHWRAFMVTFPLREAVREIEAAEVAYPSDRCAYNDWMEPRGQTFRDAEHPRSAA